jgi:plasmid maintenance system antidote protein VapI
MDLSRSGRPGVEQELVDNVQVAFQRNLQKSVRRASRELHVPKSTVHKVLHKQLHLQPYKVQLNASFGAT